MRIRPDGVFGPVPNRFSLRIQAARATPSAPGPRPNAAANLVRRLFELRDHLHGLRDAIGTGRASSTRTVYSPASAISRSPLEVTTVGSATTLKTGGLVSPPTTLVGLVKSFSGTSTSQATLDGTYDGSLGDQVELEFLVKKGGILGQDDTEIEVFDDQGTKIDHFKIRAENPGEVFTLSVGLQVRFSSGEMQTDDSFDLALSTFKGVVDPDQAFQGSGLPGGGAYQTGFELGSTAIATVGGTFSGAFDDTLRFEVATGGIIGETDVEIDVFDGNNAKIGTLLFNKELAPGTELSLSNGLTLALSAGVLINTDRFDVSVVADDQVVFGEGLRVQSGTFFINGTAITVDSLDTVRTLADEITASSAGVTASFDTASGEFLLTRTANGPGVIDLGSDDTGFFAAIGLDENQQVPGTNAGTTGVTQLSELEGLTSGTFSINGENVSVDVANDTLDDVLARINSLEADVQASFVGNYLRLQSDEAFELKNGTSAFFDAVQIDTGLYEASQYTHGVGRDGIEDDSRLKQSLGGVKRSLDSALTLDLDSLGSSYGGLLRSAILATFGVEEQNTYYLDSGLGLRFQLRDTGDLLRIDSARLNRVLSRDPQELRDFLSGPGEGDPGLIDRLSTAIDQALDLLVRQLDPVRDAGLLLDLKA